MLRFDNDSNDLRFFLYKAASRSLKAAGMNCYSKITKANAHNNKRRLTIFSPE